MNYTVLVWLKIHWNKTKSKSSAITLQSSDTQILNSFLPVSDGHWLCMYLGSNPVHVLPCSKNGLLCLYMGANYIQTCLEHPLKGQSKMTLKAGDCLMQINLLWKWTFDITKYWTEKAGGWLIEVTAITGSTVHAKNRFGLGYNHKIPRIL